MPATEQTWRNLKSLHAIFGVSSIVLLLTTIWMFVADHNRPWKQYQRKSMELDARVTDWRAIEQNNTEFKQRTKTLKAELVRAQLGSWPKKEKGQGTADKTMNEVVKAGIQERLAAVEKSLASQGDKVKKLSHSSEEIGQQFDEVTAAHEEALAKVGTLSDDKLETELAEDSKSEAHDAYRKYINERADYLNMLNKVKTEILFLETTLAGKIKIERAINGKAVSDYGQAVGNHADKKTLEEHQAKIDESNVRLRGDGKSEGLEQHLQVTKANKEQIESVIKQLSFAELDAKKQLDTHLDRVTQLQKASYERGNNWQKEILNYPIIDAFGSQVRLDQNWLPDLKQPNGSFGEVARFDRCVTCHVGIAKTKPGSAVDPLYTNAQTMDLNINFKAPQWDPAEKENKISAFTKARGEDSSFDAANRQLSELYGFMISEKGLFDEDEATINVVVPNSPAAMAGLSMGDSIYSVNGEDTRIDKKKAINSLIDGVDWSKGSVALKVRRGVPQPYCAHPRLDLFVGSMSPHPVEKFGCTICHQGNGSATEFKYASHGPNDLIQQDKWIAEQKWYNNHHWIFPMLPNRFQESSCLKCHHNVVELDASDRFPDAPAPKLVQGYNLIREYGCFGCHEINGYNGPIARVGPDLRSEPPFYAAAEQLLTDPGLKSLGSHVVEAAHQVVADPTNDSARRLLANAVAADATLATKKSTGGDNSADGPKLTVASHHVGVVLKDVETPGNLRKVGPSLRHVGFKVEERFLYDWIRDPKHFRPTSKMPQFFGLYDHLPDLTVVDESDPEKKKTKIVESPERELAERFEHIEIQGITNYLLAATQKFDYIEPFSDVEPASAERGKKSFEIRGCLACHSHDDFQRIKADQGPNLTGIGDKLKMLPNGDGKKWLYSWVRDPNRYHSRTLMPNTFLDRQNIGGGKFVDPAADITEYLMGSTVNWKPADWDQTVVNNIREDEVKIKNAERFAKFRESKYDTRPKSTPLSDLESLAFQHLTGKYTFDKATSLLENGPNSEEAAGLKGDESALVGMTPENRKEKLSQYVGRRSISKYGCFGCHDIPGYEDAKPIGTALADWGRKDPAKLAFENINAFYDFVAHAHGGHGSNSRGHGNEAHGTSAVHGAGAHGDSTRTEEASVTKGGDVISRAEAETRPSTNQQSESKDYFVSRLKEGDRIGFLWQKINAPRSYDYRKAETKAYNDRLRMPKFTFSTDPVKQQEAIESVMTFVLGLVSEPPSANYVYKPNQRQAAIVAGKKVLDKYNCAGCHMLAMERWDIDYSPDQIIPVQPTEMYPYLKHAIDSVQPATNPTPDKRGKYRASLVGLAVRNETNGEIARINADEEAVIADFSPTKQLDPSIKIQYNFMLFEPVALTTIVDGKPVTQVHEVGEKLVIPESMIATRGLNDKRGLVWKTRGGDLAKALYPTVIADAEINPDQKKGEEPFGWLPPTLQYEGHKVQTKWLHKFLLDPHPIRPAVVLRMPKFNMSSNEAQQLVDYFAAVDNVAYPYEFNSNTSDSYIKSLAEKHQEITSSNRTEESMKITSQVCSQCHYIGDYDPSFNAADPTSLGKPRGYGPQLTRVHERLRPDYLRNWIANPKFYLPYTAMPINIPYGQPLKNGKFPGDDPKAQSEAQVQGVVDLLMNYDSYTKNQFSVKQFLEKFPPPKVEEKKP